MECFSTAYLFYIGLQILVVSWTRLFLQQRCFGGLPYTRKVAKLKLFIAIRESIHFAFLRIKINLSGIYEDVHTLKDWQHHIVYLLLMLYSTSAEGL